MQSSISLNQGRLILSGKVLLVSCPAEISRSKYSCLTLQVCSLAQMLSPLTSGCTKRYAKSLLSVSCGIVGIDVWNLMHKCTDSICMQDTILREVQRYQQSHIQHGAAYGELDHPSYDSITFKELHMATVSHQVITAALLRLP